MASVLTPNQSAKWFAPIAGLTSISSVIGGTAVSILSKHLNLSGALACTAVALLISLFATGSAYSIAERNGFSPEQQHMAKQKRMKKTEKEIEKHEGLVEKATRLFARVPVLRALFLEILASQGLATLLNVCFVSSVGANIPDDNIRAGWVGNFYALINVITMMLQFGVLPLLMQYIEPKDLWRVTPLISLAFTTYQACQKNPSLYAISASLLVMKISEYSARRMLDEMVYVPLDFESRFVGKEIIGVFGYRFGKSLISLSLSGLTSIFGQFNLQSLSILSDVVAFGWAKTAWDLSSLVPTRKEAQDSYDKQSGKKSNKRATRS
jgi:ATP/ADP translocase